MSTSVVQKIANAGGVGIPVSLTTSTGATTTEGILLGTTETATVGAQKWSPSLHFQGSGWKTTATAAAQSCDWVVEIQPIQGSAAPTNQLVFKNSVNGAAYTDAINIAPGDIQLTGSVNLHDSAGSKLACFFGTGVLSSNRTAGGYYFNAGNTNILDTGLTSTAAAAICIGNGTVGDFSGSLKLTTIINAPLTVATLPATPAQGMRCVVTDASNPTFLATAVGGASTVAPVFYDGGAWKVG